MTRLVRAGWIGSILTAWLLATGLAVGVAADPPKADDKKSEEKKPEDKKPDDKKDDKKPDDKKSDDKKSDDKKTEEKKADEKPGKISSLSDEETYELFQTFVDTLDQVERNYVKKLSRKELMEAAIQGVLTKLDPYSSYVKPEDLDSFKSNVENKFGGIGIQVSFDNGQLRVLSPMYNTPAYRAGIQAGDLVLEIEGKPTREMTMDQCVHTLKGTPGTKVGVTIQHLNGKKENLTLEREIVRVETVLGDHRKPDDSWDFMLDHDKHIGYIMITAFSRETYQDLRAAMQQLSKQGLKGLILDLRFNPGGLLSSAIDICDLFVSEGKIVSTAGRNTKEQTWTAKKPGTYEDFPMVILVNRYSASASEIVSACLQDHKRAIVMGERTWGKGSVQNIIELENGKSALKLTTAGYHRPSGKNIHREANSKESDVWGVMPDTGYLLKLSDGDMFALTQNRRDRNIIHPHENAEKKPEEKKPEAKKADDKKPEANKPEDKKPDDKKPEDKKPDDKKDDKKPDAKKPDDKKPDAKNNDAKKDDKKPDAKKDGDKKPEAAKKFVDKQLQMAIDYLRKEIDKPKTADKKEGDKKDAKPATQASSAK